MEKIKVGILGCTGMVGQQYIKLLQNHPFFEINFLASSEQSANKTYKEAIGKKWLQASEIPPSIASMPVFAAYQKEEAKKACRLVFSAMSNEGAELFEEKYAKEGLVVISSASFFRMAGDVPLLIPEINADHFKLIEIQKRKRGFTSGFIVAKPNCSLQSYLIPLYPLHVKYRLKKAFITTLQAVSGAGYPGIASLDIFDNVIPFIPGEEEKSESEPLKILGKIGLDGIEREKHIKISAHCNRVPVMDGHLACISAEFEIKPSKEDILSIWKEFKGKPQEYTLPSAPSQLIVYNEKENRPQPRLDRNEGNSMSIIAGRLRDCSLLDIKFVALSHNTIRGAAGGGLLTAELLYKEDYIK